MSDAFSKTLACGFEEAVERTTAALQANGFGVLCDIDVQATMKAKLGAETPPYRILGACNPPLAHRALQAEPRVGLMLPCNVVVRALPQGTEVATIDPRAAMTLFGGAALAGIADEVADRLKAVIAAV
jgi:uncharacterized protein (DUF302 family)